MEWGIFCTFVPCMDSLNYIFGLAALAYIVTSTMFAAVRWWHTCPTTDKGYAYPDRRMQSLLYLVPAVVLAPCVAFPMRPSAHALATLYFVLCHSFFCALLLMTYFGQVKGWLRWKPWAVAQGVPVGVMVAAKAVEAWTDVAVMPERLAWWLTATVGAICLCYCIEAMRRVWLWMKPLGEDYYSNPDDLPLEYARQVLPIPVLHGVAAWTAFLVGNVAVTAVVMVLLSVFNVWFLILVLPAHRHREDLVAEVSEDHSSDSSEDALPVNNGTSTVTSGGVASDSSQKPLPRETVSRIKQQLQQYVETEEHFLDPHLTLRDVLVSGCTYNRSYVSRVLNEEMGCTFSAYVNRLRLQRADDLRRQEPQAPIGDIIARSGFDSPSNYYKAKRKYGEE